MVVVRRCAAICSCSWHRCLCLFLGCVWRVLIYTDRQWCLQTIGFDRHL